MAAKKTKREQELEQQMAVLQAQMTALLAVSGKPTSVVSGKPVVGIRNVSNYTIGFVNAIPGEQGEIQLHADLPSHHGAQSRAIVSHTFWQQLRKGKFVENGMIIRDDSVLTDSDVRSPEDRPDDLPAKALVNQVLDPHAWIEARTEEQLRQDIEQMTSEASLRRLAVAVDQKIWDIGEERYKDDAERGKKAIRDLPSKYGFVEKLVDERLIEFGPNAKTFGDERKVTAKI